MSTQTSFKKVNLVSRAEFDKLFIVPKQTRTNFSELSSFIQKTFSKVFKYGSRKHLWVFGGVLREFVSGSNLRTYFENGGDIDIVHVLSNEVYPQPKLFHLKPEDLKDVCVEESRYTSLGFEHHSTFTTETEIKVDLIQYTGDIRDSLTTPTANVNLLAINLRTGEVISRDPGYSVESIISSISKRSFTIVNNGALTRKGKKFIKLISPDIIRSFKRLPGNKCLNNREWECRIRCRCSDRVTYTCSDESVTLEDLSISGFQLTYFDEIDPEDILNDKIFPCGNLDIILNRTSNKCIFRCAKLYRKGYKLVEKDKSLFHSLCGGDFLPGFDPELYIMEANHILDIDFLEDIGLESKIFSKIFPLAYYKKTGDLSWLDSSLYHEYEKSIEKEISPKVLLSWGFLHSGLKGPYGVKNFTQTYFDILDMYIKNKIFDIKNKIKNVHVLIGLYMDSNKTMKFFRFYRAFIAKMRDETYKDTEEQKELSWSKLKSEKNFIKIILLFFSYIPELSTPKTEIDQVFSIPYFPRYSSAELRKDFINDIKLSAFKRCLLF